MINQRRDVDQRIGARFLFKILLKFEKPRLENEAAAERREGRSGSEGENILIVQNDVH